MNTRTINIAATLVAAIALVGIASTEVSAVNSHPSLFATPAGLELARERVSREDWAKKILERLVKEAGSLEHETLPVFEKDWWAESSKKRWQDTYPEINRHTMFAVIGPVRRTADTAMAYAATGDPKYAATVRRVLLHYAGYDFFAVHPDVGLNWSVWCMLLLESYDFVHGTLSDADRAKIDDFFKRAMEAIRANDEWWMRDKMGGMFNNHFAWHKLFIGTYGVFYDKPELVDYAINSDQGLRELIENGIRDDGLWLEGSINYHFTAVIGIVQFAMVLANTGNSIDLWRREFANGRSLKQLFVGPIGTLFPDETIPTIGDTYGHRAKLARVEWYYAAYDAYRLPEFAWVVRGGESRPAWSLFLKNLPQPGAAAPAMKSRVWPEHGYVALRTQEGADYWKGDGYSVFLSFDLNGIHSHADKFDLIAFGRGAHIAVDPEALASAEHAFSSRIQNELNRHTLCHNTVMIDRQNHHGTAEKLELVEFVGGDDIKMATIADTRGIVCPGVRMMRTVAATPDFVLDIFQVTSEEEHIYEYLFHTYSDTGAFEPQSGFAGIELGNEPPWKWLKDAGEKAVDGDWAISARQGDLTTRLSALGEPGTRLTTCRFPSKDTFEEPSVPMLLAGRRCKSTVFVSVLQAEKGEIAPVKIAATDYRHGLLRVSIEVGGRAREFSVRKLK